MMPVVSVIIPIYKVEQYLDDCVKSIVNQSLKDIEIILVDDGSPDNCPKMCDEYVKSDSRIKVIHKENAGLGYARNTGLEYAKGRWISFVDADDCLALNALEICVAIAEKTGVDQVRFLLTKSYGDIKPQVIDIDDKYDYCVLDKFPDKVTPMLAELMAQTNLGINKIWANASACGGIYRLKSIHDSGVKFCSERELISEDFAFNIEFAANSGSIAYTNYPFYYYRDNHESLSKMYKADRIDRSAVFCKYLRNRLSDLGYPDADLIAVGNMLGNFRSHLRHIYASDFPTSEKKRLHSLAVSHPYILQIAKSGEYKKLGLLQRLAFRFRQSYILSRMFVSCRELIRAMFKK